MTRYSWLLIAFFAAVVMNCEGKEQRIAIELRIAEEEPADALTKKIFSGRGRTETFYLHEEVLLTESDIVNASVITMQEHPAVEVIFSDTGRKKFAQITAQNINKHLAVLINGELVCAPVIRDTVRAGKAIINGDFSEEEARRIADSLGAR